MSIALEPQVQHGPESASGRLTIGRRLGLLVGLLGLGIASVACMAVLGVGRIDRSISHFRDSAFGNAAVTDQLRRAMKDTELASLEYALVENAPRRNALRIQLSGTLVPAVTASLSATAAALADEPADRAGLARIQKSWQRYLEHSEPYLLSTTPGRERAAALRIRSLLEQSIADADIIVGREAKELTAAIQETSHEANQTRKHLIIAAVIAALLGTGIAVALTRSIGRRTRHYSRFAKAVAKGSYGERVHISGNDELTELGRLLNRMMEHGDSEQMQNRQRSEYTEAMQLTGSEDEAHNLLKLHLERSITGSVVTVLSRNNSANRLEPTTPLAADDLIASHLNEAQPRDCLAVRSGQTHRSSGRGGLLECTICGKAATSACQPFLVGGEVIGAVLARRDHGLTEIETETMRASVVQAAPLLANLRNLALAEFRAGTDALTGLPNQRASHETMQRMAAQATRTRLPLSVLLLDLDRFKQINDVFGHAEGDNVLAAVGVALRSILREGDFCGRFGGEEFVVLLPNTGREGAADVAEKLRAGVEKIRVPSVKREITTSIGVATVPDHGDEAATVSRIADRALYAAKAGGRNRVELATVVTALGNDAPPLKAGRFGDAAIGVPEAVPEGPAQGFPRAR